MARKESDRKRIGAHQEPQRLGAHPEPRRLAAHEVEEAAAVPPTAARVSEPVVEKTEYSTPAFIRYGSAVILGLAFGVLCYVWFNLGGHRNTDDRDMRAQAQTGTVISPANFYLADASGQPVLFETTSFGGNVDANGVFDADYFEDELAGVNTRSSGNELVGVYDPATKVVYLFKNNSTNVYENKALSSVARHAGKNGYGVDVKAYTDEHGRAAYNRRLSERRANAVRDYLVAHGVPASKIRTAGMGPTHAFANDAQDRRAEVVLVKNM